MRADFILKTNIPLWIRKSQEKYGIMHPDFQSGNLCLQDQIARLKPCLQIPFEREDKNKIIYLGGNRK